MASFSLLAGALPPGLALNPGTGEIAGTPTTSGTYSGITIGVTDNGDSASLGPLSILIAASGSFTPSLDFSDSRNSQFL